MAGNVSVVWEGLNGWIAKVADMRQTTPEKVQTIMSEIGHESLEVMQGHTPVRTGRLREGDMLTEIEGGFELSNAVATDKGAPYNVFVWKGTRRMKAQDYVDPAVQFAIQEMEDRLPGALEG